MIQQNYMSFHEVYIQL